MLTRHYGNLSRAVRHHDSLAKLPRLCYQHRNYGTIPASALRRANTRAVRLGSSLYARQSITQIRALHHGQKFEQQSTERPVSTDREPIAILGGGITGMAAAYYLTKAFPETPVTLFERREVLGGWIRTHKEDVGNGSVTFESGPRSLRPAEAVGTLGLRLIQELDLVDDMLIADKRSPASRNRFIYYPDHLVKMPGPGMSVMQIVDSIWSEEVFGKLLAGIWNEARSPPRSADVKDESVGSFIARRTHENIANNLVSALFHGIYAGDIWRLSAKSIIAGLWAQEGKKGSVLAGFGEYWWTKRRWMFCDDLQLHLQLQGYDWNQNLLAMAKNASAYTFKNGMGQLSRALEQNLIDNPNVKIRRSTALEKVRADTRSVQVDYKGERGKATETQTFSHLISAIRPDTLAGLLDLEPSAKSSGSVNHFASPLRKHLRGIPAVTVGVVNLYYNTPNLLRKVKPSGGVPSAVGPTGLSGFGYLLPASLPFSQNPERALGVIFDSDVSPELHTTVPAELVGTRLTVMLGGHWWDGWSSYPNDSELAEMARNVLLRHLGITEMPAAIKVTLQRDCIPQYHVGHYERMSKTHDALSGAFEGRVRVAGSWFTGVGVNDCLRSAWGIVEGMKMDNNGVRLTRGSRTGLERFDGERAMALVKHSKNGVIDLLATDREEPSLMYAIGRQRSETAEREADK